jgi:hypothetical protein
MPGAWLRATPVVVLAIGPLARTKMHDGERDVATSGGDGFHHEALATVSVVKRSAPMPVVNHACAGVRGVLRVSGAHSTVSL